MLLRHLCGAILTLFFATGTLAAPQERVKPVPQERAKTAPQERVERTTSSAALEFHLASFPEHQQAIASYEKPQLKADALNEIPAASAADMKDPLKYSVWVLIGLGPIMWIWLAFFPRIRRK